MATLTEGQRALRDRARGFALERVLPLADELDPRREDIPRAFLDEVAEAGWFGVTVPTRYGGMGEGMLGYCLVVEELARAWMSVASVVGRANSHLDDVVTTDEERARYLPRVARGDFIGAFALSEERAGSDVAALETRARRDGDDWVVDGAKKWCGFARAADYLLVYARTDEPDPDRRHLGISCFLVEKERDAFPDGVAGAPVPKIGYFGITTWQLTFDGWRIPGGSLVGERGEAFYALMAGLDRKRVYTAARAVGLARGALEDAIAYARSREQFGRPIADFQAIRFTVADMATSVAAARELTHAAARELDDGAEEVSRQAAMAKLFATEVAERVASDGLQVHGGVGYTTWYAAQRHWRDARLTRIFEGTSEVQRRIISDRLLDAG